MKLSAKKPVATKKEKNPENVRRGKRSRNKGSNFERDVAKKFARAYGVELVRTPQSGGFIKNSLKAEDFRGDVVPADGSIRLILHIECKNSKRWTLPQWIEQAEGDCPKGRVPIVVFHKYNSSKDYVCISMDDFMKLVPKKNILFKRGG